MKILLFGKGGQVGWELQRSLSVLGDLVALDFDSTDYCGDFTQLDALADTVRRVRPDVIVNASAHTAVDKAESEPQRARTLNALAPARLAQEAAALGSWLVHYSTDYVFDGSGTTPWLETDEPAPLSVYGQTKLEGERLIQASGCKHLIFRTSWVYAARGGNFAKTMLRLAQERETLNVIDDQIGAPTSAELLADATAHAIRQVALQDAVSHQHGDRNDFISPAISGIYNVVAKGSISWFEYANATLALSKYTNLATKIIVKSVQPIPTSAYVTAARRPLNSRLNTAKFEKTFNLTLPDWKPGLVRMLTEFIDNQA